MNTTSLLDFFLEHRNCELPLVLATVFETQGATYSKSGARMLISQDGKFQGMLSGGCLEGDLAERAGQVIATGFSQQVTYDLGQNDEELWGMGVGCDGLMRIFLQPLTAAADYEPFATMADIMEGDSTEIVVTVIGAPSAPKYEGSTLLSRHGSFSDYRSSNTDVSFLISQAESVFASGQSQTCLVQHGDDEITVLFAILSPPPRVLVLGAGPDAEPVVRLCAELGWRVTVQDHRPAYVENGDFRSARHVMCCPAAMVSEELELQKFDAAIVMSHHLLTDRSYLGQLASTDIAYIGLLGPKERRTRLIQDLGDDANRLDTRLHGPAGLNIGGRGPASIALAIVSEMHQILAAQ